MPMAIAAAAVRNFCRNLRVKMKTMAEPIVRLRKQPSNNHVPRCEPPSRLLNLRVTEPRLPLNQRRRLL